MSFLCVGKRPHDDEQGGPSKKRNVAERRK